MNSQFQKIKVAIIGGGYLFETDFLKKAGLKMVQTPYGRVECLLFKGIFFICRHGKNRNIPPHKINHKANIFALKKLGVKSIFAFNSAGSLKMNIKPGEIVIPDDYMDFDTLTFYTQEMKHITPEISPELRKILIKILKKLKFKFHPKGIYFQTKGPRFETKAEINLIKKFADVVAMTMGSEATLSKELGLEYASVCLVDNYAQGLTKKPLSQITMEKNQKKNKNKIEKIIKEILKL